MNIVPTYPNLVPLTLQPATESAKRDNIRREIIPEPVASQASTANQQAASENQTSSVVTYLGTTNALNSKSETYTPASLKEAAQVQTDAKNNGQITDNAVEGQSSEQQKDAQSDEDNTSSSDSDKNLTEKEQKAVKDLKARDKEVRMHEQAHKSAGGQYAGSPAFDMTQGPDGQDYATGGHVDIDVTTVANDPQATIAKMAQVKKAALAPAEPSSQDMKVAAKADMIAAAAREELAKNMSAVDSSSGVQSETSGTTSATMNVNSDSPFVDQQMRERGQAVLNRYLSSGRQNAAALSQYA